jgi:hypothetical protein
LVSLWTVRKVSGLVNRGLSMTRRKSLEHLQVWYRQDPGETQESTHLCTEHIVAFELKK